MRECTCRQVVVHLTLCHPPLGLDLHAGVLEAGVELFQAHILSQLLEENLNEDTRGGRGVVIRDDDVGKLPLGDKPPPTNVVRGCPHGVPKICPLPSRQPCRLQRTMCLGVGLIHLFLHATAIKHTCVSVWIHTARRFAEPPAQEEVPKHLQDAVAED